MYLSRKWGFSAPECYLGLGVLPSDRKSARIWNLYIPGKKCPQANYFKIIIRAWDNYLDIYDKYAECQRYVNEQAKGLNLRKEEVKKQELKRKEYEDRRKKIACILQAKSDMENSEKLIPWCVVPEERIKFPH